MNRATLVKSIYGLAAVGFLASSGVASAEEKVFKYDEWDEDIATGANQVDGTAVAGHPGFAQGEAFGQIYRPTADEYPLTILGIDFVMAAPPAPNAAATIDVVFEIYNGPATGADPESQPLFTISNSDIISTGGAVGVPIQGGIGYHIEFDYDDPANHPPTIDSGNIWLFVRFTDPTVADATHWGTDILLIAGCTQLPALGACGCQAVAPFTDAVRTANANIIHTYSEAACTGPQEFVYADTLGVNGDFFLRMAADTAKAACVVDCDGRQCGSDGCGGLCGECADGLSCFQDQCVACIPNCTAAQCGDDGCGSVCGTCDDGQVCENRFCCTPNCTGKSCGDDSCGGVCGVCEGGDVCGSDGTCGVACVAECTDRDCGVDGCGGSCGTCSGTDACSADGLCETPCASDCAGKACGSDGCGDTCGSCDAGEVCGSDNTCETACAPLCDEKTCGDNGCGGTCGTCVTGETCVAQLCTTALTVDDVSPDTGTSDRATAISITGSAFEADATVLLGGTSLTPVTRVSSQVLTTSVPAGVAAGTYTVIVTNPGGASATLTDGFTVTAAGTGGGNDSGCQTGGGGGNVAWLLAAMLLALAVGRRRLA